MVRVLGGVEVCPEYRPRALLSSRGMSQSQRRGLNKLSAWCECVGVCVHTDMGIDTKRCRSLNAPTRLHTDRNTHTHTHTRARARAQRAFCA